MKLRFVLVALTLTIFFCSCSDGDQNKINIPMQNIQGRNYEGRRFDVYRIRAPVQWIRKDPLPEESLVDTTKSLCEFLIPFEEGTIRIAIHNFPSETLDQRIPPTAQIARWQRQFEMLEPSESGTISQAFSGYSGLKFKGVGIINKDEVMMLGWSLQLSPEHYRTLSQSSNLSEKNLQREMRADVTIKAVGPKDLMEANEEEISRFARSFELIKEIPSRQ